jgi:beta-lactam-binding protein with PASTA domain
LAGQDVALDLSTPTGGTAVGFRFATGTSPASGNAPMPLIDVHGYTPALARRKLTDQGFVAVLARAVAPEASRGVVSDQAPPAGTLVAPGTVVRLTIS